MSGDNGTEEAQARLFQEALMMAAPLQDEEAYQARAFQEALELAEPLQYRRTASNIVGQHPFNPPSISLLDLIRNSSVEDQAAAFSELLKLQCTTVEVDKQQQYNSSRIVSFPANNGKRIGFYLFPSCINSSENDGEHGPNQYSLIQRTYKRKMQPQQFESFLISCFGSIEAGVSIWMDSCSSVGNGDQFHRYLLEKKSLCRRYTEDQCLDTKICTNSFHLMHAYHRPKQSPSSQ
jgi:hypothetical protein